MKLQTLIDERLDYEKDNYQDITARVIPELVTPTDFMGHPFSPKGEGQFLSRWLDISANDSYHKVSLDTQQLVLNERVTEKLKGRELMFRLDSGVIRGVVSDKYKVINHSEVLLKLLDELGNIDVDPLLGEGNMNTRLTLETGDLQTGITLGNSEVGEGSVFVAPFIYRLVCSNGLIVAKKEITFRHTHRGYGEYSLGNAINDAVKEAQVSKVLFEQTQTKQIADPMDEIVKMLKKLNLPSRMAEGVQEAFNIEPVSSGFGIINALTRYAKDSELTERVMIEKSASKLLSVYNRN